MQICYSQPTNVKRIVTQKKIQIQIINSAEPWLLQVWTCGRCRVSSPIIKEGDTFTSTNTRKTYNIRQNMDCTSSYVIYLGTCEKCGGQYVGKSQTPLKVRHSNHKQEIKKKIGRWGQHYGGKGCGYESISIQIIDQVKIGDNFALKDQEIYWQTQLNTATYRMGAMHTAEERR